MFTTERFPATWFQEKRITVMGLGSFGGGRGVAEFLCRRGAYVTVTDLKSADQLRESQRTLSHLPIRWVLGEHRDEDFLTADLVVASPAVPRTSPYLRRCVERGIPLETEMNLFFKYCRGSICGVTGSNGKTTTASLIAEMARRGPAKVYVGGNMGRSLLPDVDLIRPEDWVILELSSFQLEDMGPLDRRPDISVVTNLSPNHLDRHGDFVSYVRAKEEIVHPPTGDGQRGRGVAILSGDDPALRAWAHGTTRRVVFFGRTNEVTPRVDGVWWDVSRDGAGDVWGDVAGKRHTLFAPSDLRLKGRFNVINAAGAAAAALEIGVPPDAIRKAVRDFRPVTHRLEHFLTHDGVEYYDDSIATTPESTIAALDALGPDVLLICGGSSKGCSFDQLAESISRRAKCVFLIGSTADEIQDAMLAANRNAPPIDRSGTLEDAVESVRALAARGDRVVLSPACPSYDQFGNFEERGRRFKELVRVAAALPTNAG